MRDLTFAPHWESKAVAENGTLSSAWAKCSDENVFTENKTTKHSVCEAERRRELSTLCEVHTHWIVVIARAKPEAIPLKKLVR
jgi:hypothetical protein